MQKSCKNCAQNFEITNEDVDFYDKISPIFSGKKHAIPAPILCPDCRQQRRLAFRNERKLYKRKCDATGKEIISIYSPEIPFKVYDQTEWWSDRWDALEYGREFDFNRPFLEQFKELTLVVPHISLHTKNAENSEYTNYTLNLKNCYLIFGGANDENCLYGHFISDCRDVTDCSSLYSCELGYEGIASQGCFNCFFFSYCRNCSDCFLVEDCLSCRNCIGCFGLRQKEYYLFNKFVGQEKFTEYKNSLFSALTWSKINELKTQFTTMKLKLPHRKSFIVASENCKGDMIFNSQNCQNCFDITDCQDCQDLFFSPKSVDSQDCSFTSPAGVEHSFNLCSSPGTNFSLVTFISWYNSQIYYSIECNSCQNLFGCIGLRNNKYCILNKQYSKEDYEKLVTQIINQLQSDNLWGEYFSTSICPCAYNESIAQEYFPLIKEAALNKGYHWQEEDTKQYLPSTYPIPGTINEVPETITKEILACEQCSKNYKIIPQELKFYRMLNLPLPHLCPDCRHQGRLAIRNPRKLWKRNCAKCGAGIETTYSPERPEIVYCERCYLKEIT